ncbi:MAG: hypothetical protein ACM3U1_00250 [Chloroflexota bacterium]
MKRTLFILILMFIGGGALYSQSGMKFGEFAKRLEQYYDKEMIEDIREQLPQGSDYSVWGWDVGDFSGDGNPDCAFSIRVAAEKGRGMHLYCFVDIDGYMNKVGEFPYEFVELPLEIGVAIKNNACFVTKKNKQFDWIIRGYTFDNGSMLTESEFSTRVIGDYTRESYKNYRTLQNTIKYFLTKNGKMKFFTDYLTVPSYSRGRLVYKGYSAKPVINDIDYCPSGAFWWGGDSDLTYKVASAYDDEFLYLTIDVTDDYVVGNACDTCFGDRLNIWFDTDFIAKKKPRLIEEKNNSLIPRLPEDTTLVCISVLPGDFVNTESSFSLSSSGEIDDSRKLASRGIKAVADLTEIGYQVKVRIPFEFLGIDLTEERDEPILPLEIGAEFVVDDYDNEFRPEERTELANSIYQPFNPATFGSITLMPDGAWYGASTNIFQDDILRHLLEYGF